MIRFNSTVNAVEVYDNSTWTTVGTPSFTVISDQQFSGDGANTNFTLTGNATTTAATIVSINGVVQVPTIAYSISGAGGNILAFTEAPQTGDLIDVRVLTTTTSVTSISNSPGNAVVAVSATTANVDVTGTLSASGNIISAGNISGSYLLGNAYYVTGLSPTQIYNGNSNVTIASSAGNVAINVNGSGIVSFTTAGIINNMGNATGNIGNATGYFNTVFAKATSAQYADLAEVYAADNKYEPGTVLSLSLIHI